MKSFLDTSVIVAAFWRDHRDHAPSLRTFVAANPEDTACGIHSLAEVYATMTALPVRPLLSTEQAYLFVEQMMERLTVAALDASEYMSVIRELSDRRFVSGRVYDALLLACARKVQAEVIYTWNVQHFAQLAPDLAGRIRTP